MIEQRIDILSPEVLWKADCICFTSNGVCKNNGELVMGAGVAKKFKEAFPESPVVFGEFQEQYGNQVDFYERRVTRGNNSTVIYVARFPTKNHWRNPSNLKLIETSAKQLMVLVDKNKWKKVYLPKPGCSHGGLSWQNQVKPAIINILDDRITICSWHK